MAWTETTAIKHATLLIKAVRNFKENTETYQLRENGKHPLDSVLDDLMEFRRGIYAVYGHTMYEQGLSMEIQFMTTGEEHDPAQ